MKIRQGTLYNNLSLAKHKHSIYEFLETLSKKDSIVAILVKQSSTLERTAKHVLSIASNADGLYAQLWQPSDHMQMNDTKYDM